MMNGHDSEQKPALRVGTKQPSESILDYNREKVEHSVKQRIELVRVLVREVCRRYRYDDIRIEIDVFPDFDGVVMFYKLKLTRSLPSSELSDDIIPPISGYLKAEKFQFPKIPNYFDVEKGVIEMNFFDEISQLPNLAGKVFDRSSVRRK